MLKMIEKRVHDLINMKCYAIIILGYVCIHFHYGEHPDGDCYPKFRLRSIYINKWQIPLGGFGWSV